jgi:hypothetical protein
MQELPSPNNVYGSLVSATSLEKVADILRSRLGLTKLEVSVYKSQFDRQETLQIRTTGYEFDTQKIAEENTWLLNGSVAGDLAEILTVLKYLSDPLNRSGYQTKFEVCDTEFNCIAEYPTLNRDA